MGRIAVRRTVGVALLVILMGLLIGQFLPRPSAAAADQSQYLPVIARDGAGSDPLSGSHPPAPTAVPGGPASHRPSKRRVER